MSSILRLFPSKWLRGEDIKPDEVVTIKYVREELVGHDQESKPCIYFQEYEKGCVLNKTNALNIVDDYGEDEETWTGKKLVLTLETVRFEGKKIRAIRMAAAPAKQEAKPIAEELNDSVPF